MIRPSFKFKCPKCNTDHRIEVPQELRPEDQAPDVKAEIRPKSCLYVYTITSEEMKHFITQLARNIVSDVKVEVVPRYCEKKQRKKTDPHRSYASLRIAFSQEIIENHKDMGWFGKIGDTNSNAKIIGTFMDKIISRYRFDRKTINEWMRSYKTMDELEENFGITSQYLNDLQMYANPQRVPTNNGNESWIIFSAAAEQIIADMLSFSGTTTPIGKIMIQDVRQISKDNVEWIVHVDPNATQSLKENPHVRQILLGDK